MYKLLKLLIIQSTVFICFHAYSQEIDQSTIENLTADQISLAKEILDSNEKKLITKNSSITPEEESLEEKKIDEKSLIPNPMFGYNFISSSPTSISATGDLPLPNEYRLAIGDLIGVILTGSIDQMFDMQVELDGTVFFPEIGSISVAGETFEDVKKKLRNIINQSYIGVSIDLSLKNLSAKKITIVGTVNNPGTYLVNPFTTISNALAYSGGVQKIGSLRTIKLIRANSEFFVFDLYDLLIDGSRTNDITIESGDVIIVGAASKFINISGMVKRPGGYEILQGENLSDLLRFSLGFSGGANAKKIILDKIDIESGSIIKIITDDVNYSLDNILSVYVYPYQNEKKSKILVSGAVKEPGYFEIDDYNNLEELIEDIEFIDVYPWLATLEQFDENNLIKSSILFNLDDPNTYQSIKLLPGSKLYFANNASRMFDVDSMTMKLIDDYTLTINHKQGSFTFPVFGKYSVKSFIDLLGLDMSDVDEEATYVSPLDNLVIIDNYNNMNFVAKKYNNITFRSPVNDLIRVSISGAIDYPGTYTLQPETTMEDLYSMIGGFKKEAFFNGIVFTRETIRQRQLKSIQKSKDDLNKSLLLRQQKGQNIGDINIIRALSETIEPENLGRIAGDFSPGSSSSIKTILANGDSIFIPRNPNVINVLGEVLNPIAFEYSNRINVRTAIANAGGYQDFADKRKVYVIKANGMIKKANRNIFVNNFNLEPGDSIIVPRKIITNNPGIDALLPLTQILSDLAFSAAALETLSNN